MKNLSIYLTPSHASVTVANGASRQTSASNMFEVLAAMPAGDRVVLVAFCEAVLAQCPADDSVHFDLLTTTVEAV